MPRVGTPHNGVDHGVFGGLFLNGQRGTFQIERDSMAEEFDMGQFFCGGHHQHVAIFIVAPRAHGLEEILHGDADLALDAADRLLQELGELRIGLVDADGVLELGRMVKHDLSLQFR